MSEQKKFRQGKRRVLKDLRIDEISAVDFPAQQGARAVLTKRRDQPAEGEDGSELGKCGGPDYGPTRQIVMLTTEEKGHAHVVRIYAGDRGGNTSFARVPSTVPQEDHDHGWTMDSEGNVSIASNDGHTHGVSQKALVQSILALVKRAASSGEKLDLDPALMTLVDKAGQPTEAPMTTTPAQQPGELETLRKELEVAKKLVELNDAQRAHYAKLDDAGKTAFLAKSAADRQAVIDTEVRKAADSDPVEYVSPITGRQFRKSAGADVIDLAKRADVAEALSKKSADDVAQAGFEKRADSELAKFQGETKVRAAIIKAVEGIADADVRKAALESLKAANVAMSGVFEKRGTFGGAPVADKQAAIAKLDELAKARQREKGEDYYVAYDVVKSSNPELHRLAVSGAA